MLALQIVIQPGTAALDLLADLIERGREALDLGDVDDADDRRRRPLAGRALLCLALRGALLLLLRLGGRLALALLTRNEPFLALLLGRGRGNPGRRGKKQETRQKMAQAHRVWIPGNAQKRVPKPNRTVCVWS
ncbi:hypothetical protein [Falsiroseomonas oryzae]|uniref:hypothetical protein n=1 Tax=Falsiroseomonas oryzae TaxID=2766473 RepID=UPI0022EAC02B|nr:hypothetical protein [Roseomonas sp. MO-31]